MTNYVVNSSSTRSSDIVAKSGDGLDFSGFNGMQINIGEGRAGTIDLGTRKVIYDDIVHFGFISGSYSVLGTSDYNWFWTKGDVTAVLSGNGGGDTYVISQSGGQKLSQTYITDFDLTDDTLYIAWFGNYKSNSPSDTALLEANINAIHTGSGENAYTKITITTPTKNYTAEVYLKGHVTNDGIEPGWNPSDPNSFQLYLKPASQLNMGTFELPKVTNGSNSSNSSGSSNAVSYTITANSQNASEGSNAIFLVSSTGAAVGTSVPYSISGVSASDIVGGLLTGTAILDTSGKATISIGLNSDSTTEGTETITVTAGGKTASTLINDTSIGAAVTATYTLVANSSTVSEGSTAKLTITGTNAAKGTVVPYVISGIAAEDLTSGEVSGRVTLDDLGMGTISIPIAADMSTEGSEAMIISVGGQVATITINDTSKSGSEYFVSASDGVVDEGRVATFTVSAGNAVAGTKLAYTLSGSGITAKDIGNGKLTGSVSIGSDSSAIITVPLAADKTTEGDEELTLTLTGKGVSETITIEDTSTAAAVVATYSLSAVESSVDEGSDAEFLIETDASEAGKSFKWTVTGVSAADVVGKKLTGTVTIDADGTATISIPTATDALTEGNETLTLTANGQKATVAVLDNNTVTIASVVLESDSLGSSAIYKLSDGTLAIAEAGLYDGDTLEDYVPLKASPSTNYAAPKTVAALISYSDGGYGLLSKTGSVYSEQKFSEDGIAKGKATKLTSSQLLSKETDLGVDLDDDGNIGDAIVLVLDEDGDTSQQDSGLFQTLTGTVVIASTDLGEGDAISDGLVLMASKTKTLTLKSTQTVLGLAQKESGNWEVLIQAGKVISAQTFDADTGLMKGKAVVLKTAQLNAREYYYDLDLTGDDEISIVGQEMMPAGWAI